MLLSERVAEPAATVLVPSEVAPLKNCTVPAAPAPVTVAVSVRAAGATAVAAPETSPGRWWSSPAAGGAAVTVSATLPEVLEVNAPELVGVNTAR